MNLGKTLFAQIMDFIPWTSFGRIVNRYGGDFAVFLTGYAPARELVYLADVARLEWAIDQANIAADAPEIDGNVRLLPPEKASKQLRVGEFTRARIVGTQGHDLVAVPI